MGARCAAAAGWPAAGCRCRAQTLELTQARATVTVNGVTTTREAIQLPYHWDRYNKGERGEAVFEIPFNLPEVPAEPWGLFFPRLGNAYEVRLNGALLQRQGDLRNFNGADYSQVPRFVAIPEGLLRTANLFQVRIRADVGRRGGLSQLVVGPQEDVYAAYLRSFHWRGTGTMVVAAFSLLVGLLALALWATQLGITLPGLPGVIRCTCMPALAEFAWAFGVGYAVLEKPPLPWPWWGVLPVVGVTIWTCCMALFCLEVAQWGRHPGARWFRRWLVYPDGRIRLAAGLGAGMGPAPGADGAVRGDGRDQSGVCRDVHVAGRAQGAGGPQVWWRWPS